MANQKIVLAELDLDAKALLKAAADAKDAIIKLTKEIEACKQAGSDFSKLQTQLENVTSAYEAQEQAITVNIQVNQTLIAQQNNLTLAQQNTVVAVQEVTTAVKAQGKTFDDYKEQINDALNSINIFNGGWSALKQRAQESNGWSGLFKTALGGVTQGLKGMGQAIMTNPLGLLLQLVAPIIEQLKNFAPLTNAVEQAMAALSPVIDLVTAPIKLLAEGITWVVKGFAELVGGMSNSADEALKLTQAQQQLTTQMARQESANEKAKQQTDELIKKSQDHTLSEQERAKAVEDATKVQLKNYNERKAIADKTFTIEEGKLAQAKDLSDQELEILSNGTDAQVNKLMNAKNISKEELDVYEKAKVEKMRIATEEEDIKESQANAIKSITDELIKKSEDQTLSEKERIAALQQAHDIESGLLNKRKTEAETSYNITLAYALKAQGVSDDEIAQVIKQGDSYKNKAQLIKLLSANQLKSLEEANVKRKVIGDEEIKLNTTLQTGLTKIHDDETSKRNATAKKNMDDAITKQKQLLDLYAAQGHAGAKTLQQQLAFENEYAKKSQALLDKELAAKKVTQEQYKIQSLAIESSRMQNLAQININYGKAQLGLWQEEHQTLIKSGQALTQATVAEEKDRLNKLTTLKIQQIEKEYALNADDVTELKAKNAVLTTEQTNFYTNLLQLKRENTEQETALNKSFADADAADKAAKITSEKTVIQEKFDSDATQRALDYEVKIAESDSQYETDLLKEQQRADNEKAEVQKRLADNIITKQQAAALEKAIDEETASNKKKLAIQNMQTQLGTMQSVAGALSDAFGQSKEMAIAQATMNAGQAILSIWSGTISGNPLIDAIIKGALTATTAIKTGKQIKEIQSAKKPKQPKFAQGGLVTVGGNRHSAGGTMFTGADGTRFEAEQGELIGVMNRNAAAHFMAFNNAFPAGGSSAPNYFASGGIVSREMAQPGLNIDELAAKIASANASMPAPVVAVQDIINQGNSYVRVRDAANF